MDPSDREAAERRFCDVFGDRHKSSPPRVVPEWWLLLWETQDDSYVISFLSLLGMSNIQILTALLRWGANKDPQEVCQQLLAIDRATRSYDEMEELMWDMMSAS